MSTTLSTINSVINDRRRETSNSSIDMTTVGFRAINSALEIWNEVHDWPWTIKQVNFNYNNGIDTYALDTIVTDFKFPLTVKFYKPNGRVSEFWMVSPLRFDSAILWSRRFCIPIVGTVQTIRLKSPDGLSASVNTASAYNQNGTWVGASAIGTVATDNYEGWSYPSSVSFAFNGTAGTLTNDGNTYTTFKALDLSPFQNRSNIYFYINASSVTNLTSYTLKWGTDSSNYWQATATTDFIGAVFATGWQTIKIPWSNPTTVGTPTITSIKYLQLTVTCSGSTNLGTFRVQNFFVSENVPIQLTYYSTNMVSTAAGVQSQIFASSAATTDLPLWSGRWDAATEPFINSVLEIIFWMTGETTDMAIAKKRISEIVTPLKSRYPSQRRYPAIQMTTDTNYQSNSGGWPGFSNQ